MRDGTMQPSVGGAIHLAHPAFPQRGENLERPQTGADAERHGLDATKEAAAI